MNADMLLQINYLAYLVMSSIFLALAWRSWHRQVIYVSILRLTERLRFSRHNSPFIYWLVLVIYWLLAIGSITALVYTFLGWPIYCGSRLANVYCRF